MESIARAKAIFVLLYFIFEKVVTFLVCVGGGIGGELKVSTQKQFGRLE